MHWQNAATKNTSMSREKHLHEDPFDGFKQGDSRALQAIFKLFYPPLCLFAERMLRDRPAAEDIVGDTFVKLWKRHADFENLQNVKAFVYITTRNACLNALKQMQREQLSKKQLAYLSGDKETFILNEIVRNEVLQEINREIEKLPGQCRKIFKMSLFEGRKNQEIADLLHISVHTVKNQKARAIQLLKVKLPDRNLVALLIAILTGIYT
jgi:RNA polymerase sigma-70 factor (family 1)